MSNERIRYRPVGRHMVVVHLEGEAPPDEYDALMRSMNEHGHAMDGLLVDSIGGTLTATQRKRLTDTLQRHEMTAAVLTDSVLARGVATALVWLSGSRVRVFPRREIQQACRHLQMDDDTLEAVIAVANDLAR